MNFRLPVCSRTENVDAPIVRRALGYTYSLPLKSTVPDMLVGPLVRHDDVVTGCISLAAFHVPL